jgi:hypothetical protein
MTGDPPSPRLDPYPERLRGPRGILRTDALNAAGSVLDITALVALAGWTILELIAIWVVRLFRRDPA